MLDDDGLIVKEGSSGYQLMAAVLKETFENQDMNKKGKGI